MAFLRDTGDASGLDALDDPGLWIWYHELIGLQNSGLEAMVSQMMTRVPMPLVRAFVAFRSALISRENETAAQRSEHEAFMASLAHR